MMFLDDGESDAQSGKQETIAMRLEAQQTA